MANILIPIAGRAQRFIDAGLTIPKPLIIVKDQMMIDLAMQSIEWQGHNLIFCVRKDHVLQYSMDKILRQKFGENIKIIVVDKITKGTVSTCLLAKEFINNDEPLLIYTPDIKFSPKFTLDEIEENLDGMLLTFKANSSAHSYCKTDINGLVTDVAEKEVISGEANVGVYFFRRGKDFVFYAEDMIDQGIMTNGEYYVAPVYNGMINNKAGRGNRIKTKLVDEMHVLGTPEDVDFYVTRVSKRFGDKPVALCADHSGFELKEKVKAVLTALNISFIDFGTYTNQDCDHVDFLPQTLKQITNGICDFGIAFCSTGQAFNIGANKVSGIRSALIFDEHTAEFSIRHNAANFFCIPSLYVKELDFQRIIESLQAASFQGGRHKTRIERLENVFGI